MQLKGKKVVIVGMGRTALALARLLVRQGAHPFVTECNSLNDRLEPIAKELQELGVEHECGGHTDRAFAGAELVIPSPGVPPAVPPIRRACEAGAHLAGEMECAFSFCRSRVLAVTGTNGKTTTTELLRALVQSCGRSVALAGNNDFPFSQAVSLDPAPEFVVLEVSSYQLETIQTFRPWVAAVLNVTPDHLARHKTLDEYAAVKQRIFMNQGAGDAAVLNADDPRTVAMTVPPETVRWTFSQAPGGPNTFWANGESIHCGDHAVGPLSANPLPGRHNLANVLAALAMARAAGLDWEAVLGGLRAFRGVEHRIEPVATLEGIRFINDSKATNIDSLRVALEAFEEPIVLIAGGQGKGADYRVLREQVAGHVKHLVLLGEEASRLQAAFGDLAPTEPARDMDEAVHRAAAAAASGDIVLLSPACASFDQFDNFEHRGRVFKESVLRYIGERPL